MEAPGPSERNRVDLPDGAGGAFEVFVNGVQQFPGTDFVQEGRELVFREPLVVEGRLGTWRWLSIFFGVAGTYRRNDTVDLVYTAGTRRVVATLVPHARDGAGGGGA